MAFSAVGLSEFVDDSIKVPAPQSEEIVRYANYTDSPPSKQDAEWIRGLNVGEICLLFNKISVSKSIGSTKSFQDLVGEIKGQSLKPAFADKRTQERLCRGARYARSQADTNGMYSEPSSIRLLIQQSENKTTQEYSQ